MNQQTVGQLATQLPDSVRVFEKYRIDYCCGGNRMLQEACQERGVSAEAVLAELEQAAPAPAAAHDWPKAALAELIAHIVSAHHAYLKAELPVLSARMTKVIAAHSANHSDTLIPLQNALEALSEELTAHLRKEEFILFPAIEALEAGCAASGPCGVIANPIRMMIFEHDNAGQALAEMRRLTCDYTLPPDACNTFRALYQGLERLEADLHQHIHLENNILFPRALELQR